MKFSLKQATIFFFAGAGITSLLAFKKEVVESITDNLNYEVMLVPKSTMVMSGEKFEADVIVFQIDTTVKYQTFFTGDKMGLMSDKGHVKYERMESGIGSRSISGYVNVKTKSSVKRLPFSMEYMVYTGAASISANMMNLLYIGVENPVSINVPGFPADKVSIACTGGNLKKNGRGYTCKVSEQGECTFHISVLMDNGSKMKMGSMSFRARELPKPVARIGTLASGRISLNEIKTNAEKVNAISPVGTPFENIEYNVIQYTLSVISKNGIINSALSQNSALKVLSEKDTIKLNTSAKQLEEQKKAAALIENLQVGDYVMVSEVWAIGPEGKIKVEPLIIEVE